MDSSPRSRHFIKTITLLGATLLTWAVAQPSADKAQNGIFALAGAPARTSARLSVNSSNARTAANRITLQFYPLHGGQAIAQFDRERTKFVHFIVVRDDFREYLHLHPERQSSSFITSVALAQNHRYYAYADVSPHGIGQQVFRFTLQGNAPDRRLQVLLSPSARQAMAGPYTVILSQTRPRAHQPLALSAAILRYGRPAKDIRPYLGAAAHVVIIDTSSLNYLHVHPESPRGATAMHGTNMTAMQDQDLPSSATVSPELTLHVSPLQRNAYKLFLEFRGGNTVYTAPFTLIAR
ncbi:MAG: hypothetical protein M3160_02190 [Candidatus Eremiobacteraeota bacterium]|nr:hypothetical protein [Candidatus Eremiobacteraeota bacterium]